MFRTGIVIITHNSGAHIVDCLDAVERFRSPQDRVLVIDNASPVRHVASIQNEANLGFAGAANQGFAALKDQVDAILLLNPDVILTAPLAPLAEACATSGIAGGSLIDRDGIPQIGFSFRRFPTPTALLFEIIGINKLWKWNPVNRRYRCLDADHGAAQAVDQPAGAMLMIRKDVWESVGGFDEGFHPVWFEDVDFCFRASIAGFRAAYVPGVTGIHEGGHSVLQLLDRNRKEYWYASLMRYSRKHFGRVGHGLVAGGVAMAAVARVLGMALRLQSGSLKDAAMNLKIARKALMYRSHNSDTGFQKTGSASGDVDGGAAAADVRSRVFNEGSPSKQNTERMLKRLHAR